MDAPGPGPRGGGADRVLGVGQLSALRSRRTHASILTLVLGAGLLAGCGGGPSATVLTNAALPANLHMKQNNSKVAQNLAAVFTKTYPGCVATYAVFTLNGRAPTPALTGKIYPQVESESANCPSTAKAQAVFQGIVAKIKSFGAKSISSIGDGAIETTSTNGGAVDYVIFWQDGPALASVQLSGKASDSQITAAETELLARRQIALQ